MVGTTAGGTGAHVGMLAAGCARRGVTVSVLGPASAAAAAKAAELPGVAFTPVEFGDRPRLGDLAAILRLRRALRSWPDGVVHAHGLRAGALTVLALAGPRARRPPIVVTAHNAPPYGGGAAAAIYGLLERVVARGADLVLCVSGDLEERMRAAGARRVGKAAVAAPDTPVGEPPEPDTAANGGGPPASGEPAETAALPGSAAQPGSAAVTGAAALPGSGAQPGSAAPGVPPPDGRPVVLAVGRLAAQKGFGVLLDAAARWRDLEPEPRLVIAGDGPLAGELSARAAALGVRAEFLGRRDDVPALLASADVFVLPSRWEGQPLVLQEALRAGVPVVATRAGGIPALTGDEVALLVPPGDAARLAEAVRAVLRDPALAARLRAAARERAAALPSEDDAVEAVLVCYADVMAGRA